LGRCKHRGGGEGQREQVAQSHEVDWFLCVMVGERCAGSTHTRF
jgi:hypothetical protein